MNLYTTIFYCNMLENTCNVSKHSTKNSYQTIIITFPRFCFVLATKNKNEKNKNKNKRHEKRMAKMKVWMRRGEEGVTTGRHGQSGCRLDRQR